MSDHFDLDAARFMWVRQGVSPVAPRAYLEGVRVEPRPEGGALLVATDGAILFAAVDPSAVCPRAATVDVEPCHSGFDGEVADKDGLESPRSDWSGMRLRFDLGAADDSRAVATFALPNSTECCFRHGVARTVAGTYPDWRTCLTRPDRRAPGLPVLDPRLIRRSAFQGQGVVIAPRGSGRFAPPGEPSVILPMGAPWGFVVLMPMVFAPEHVLPADALARAMFDAAVLDAITGEDAAT
jgi:hypothetical protein